MGKRILIFSSGFILFLFILGSQTIARADVNYVGSETCKGCHEAAFNSYAKSIHAKKAILGSPANKDGCESCHGPGAEHAGKGGGKGTGIFTFAKKVDAKEKSAKCLTCHENGRPLTFWDSGKHKKNDVACSDCHSTHKKEIYTKEYETCNKCHKDIKVQMNKRSRHPILEGKVKCSNCHNPHGSLGPSMIQTDSVNQLCYKCHAEKRGPYLWEHPAVEENCGHCHTPHGSRHTKLKVDKIPNLCNVCHDWQRHAGTRYSAETAFTGSSPSNRFFARSCMNCHHAIHGSNAPANPASGYNSGQFLVR